MIKMPFEQGQSGNPKGRPKQTDKQKKEKERFTALLQGNTVSALESIIDIATSPKGKDRFNACRYIIDKAYGSEPMLLINDDDRNITIRIVKATSKDDRTIITHDNDTEDDRL